MVLVYGQDLGVKWKKGLFRMGCMIKVEFGSEKLGVVVFGAINARKGGIDVVTKGWVDIEA